MSTKTDIEWTDTTWNPVRGCSLVSAGCANCYAMKTAHRFSGKGKPYEGLTELGPQGPRWTGKIKLVPEALEEPLHWKTPRRVFVNSMSDLFHEDVPDKFIAAVFGVMAACSLHTFQILTKRPERMRQWFRWVESKRSGLTVSLVKQGGAWPKVDEYSAESVLYAYCAREVLEPLSRITWAPWPLPNVHLGVSIEDQATADERIPILLNTPAAVRFISAEPLLGPVDLRFLQPGDPPTEINALAGTHGVLRPHGGTCAHLDWVIVGGESGPGARPCEIKWIYAIKEQCQTAAVPVFVKQLGSNVLTSIGTRRRTDDKKGADMAEWPEGLRVREFPR